MAEKTVRPVRRRGKKITAWLVVRFDVTALTTDERDQLEMEVAVQAEASDGHPSVPAPKVTVEYEG